MDDAAYGPQHPDTLTAGRNLARWTGMAGDAAGARDQFAALVSLRERVLGAEHPDTLGMRHNLAGSIGRAGDAAGARDQLAALLRPAHCTIIPKIGRSYSAIRTFEDS